MSYVRLTERCSKRISLFIEFRKREEQAAIPTKCRENSVLAVNTPGDFFQDVFGLSQSLVFSSGSKLCSQDPFMDELLASTVFGDHVHHPDRIPHMGV